MSASHLLVYIVAITVPSLCQHPSCDIMQCNGPRFTRSVCCEGYICVSSGHNVPLGMLMCVDRSRHLKVKSFQEIILPQRKNGLPLQQNILPHINQQPLFINGNLGISGPQNPFSQDKKYLSNINNNLQNPFGKYLTNSNVGHFGNQINDPRLLQDARVNPSLIDVSQSFPKYHGNSMTDNGQGRMVPPSNAGLFPNSNSFNPLMSNSPQNMFHQIPNLGNFIPTNTFQNNFNFHPDLSLHGRNDGRFVRPIQLGFRSKGEPKSNTTRNTTKASIDNSTSTRSEDIEGNGNTTVSETSRIDNSTVTSEKPKALELRSKLIPDPQLIAQQNFTKVNDSNTESSYSKKIEESNFGGSSVNASKSK